MECDEVKVRLWEYLDRELASEDACALARHLSECSDCYPAYSYNQAPESSCHIRFTCTAPVALMRWVRSQPWIHDLMLGQTDSRLLYPFQIVGVAINQGDRDELWNLVGMELTDAALQQRQPGSRRFQVTIPLGWCSNPPLHR